MEEENPATNQDDSLNFADRTDFFGAKHKYHRDCDGLYSPPLYLFDETSSDYQNFLVNGPVVPLDDTEIGMDGTTKHFVSVGNNVRACDYIQDRYGSRTNLVYGANVGGASVSNLLSTVTDPVGRQLVFTWANKGTAQAPIYRIVQVDGPQYSVLYGYNVDANLSSVTLDPGGVGHQNRTTTFGYTTYAGQSGTETGLLSSVTDPLGHSVSYGHGFNAALGSTAVTSIVENGGVDASNTPRLHTWTITPGGPGQNQPLGTGFTDDAGLTSGTYHFVAVDSQLRSIYLWTNGEYEWYSSAYDSASNVTQTESIEMDLVHTNQLWHHRHLFTYGPHGNQLTHSVDGFAGTDTTAYYNGSQYFQKQSVTDMNGHTTTFGVGSKYAGTAGNADTNPGDRGSVLWVKDAKYGDGTLNASGTRFQYTYNASGQKISEANQGVNGGAGIVTNYTYGDAWGNLTSVVQDPGAGHLARTTSMDYDVAGHVLHSTDPLGQQSTFVYNNLGQPTSASFPAKGTAPAETVSYGYDTNGRTSTVSDNRGTTVLAYENGCDRVHSVTDPVTGTLAYTYGVTGERLSMSLPGGGSWTYGYAAPNTYNSSVWPKDDPNSVARRLTSLTDDAGRRIDVSLLMLGTMARVTSNQVFDAGNNPLTYQQSDYYYDGSSVATHKWLASLSNTFHYKDANNAWQSKLLVGNTYTYDTAGQRLTNTLSSLDAGGNPVSRVETYGYDELNRLSSVNYGDGQTQSYTFDAMGNRLSKTDAGGGLNGTETYGYNNANMLLTRAGNNYTNDADGNTLTGGGRTNTWDSENRMVKCVNGANTSTFTYGADGIRRRSVVNGTATDFVTDASMFVRELSGGSSKATYFMGASGPAYRRDDVTSGIRWYLYDGLGSVLGEVDPNGNITATRKYDVYGAVRSSTGTSTSKHKFVGSLGHPSEDETGLTYMRARYYDPAVGRFSSQDPACQRHNWFNYCHNNPINHIDASGRSEIDDLFDAVREVYQDYCLGQATRDAFLVAAFQALNALRKMIQASMTLGQAEIDAGIETIKDGNNKGAEGATLSLDAGEGEIGAGALSEAGSVTAEEAINQIEEAE